MVDAFDIPLRTQWTIIDVAILEMGMCVLKPNIVVMVRTPL